MRQVKNSSWLSFSCRQVKVAHSVLRTIPEHWVYYLTHFSFNCCAMSPTSVCFPNLSLVGDPRSLKRRDACLGRTTNKSHITCSSTQAHKFITLKVTIPAYFPVPASTVFRLPWWTVTTFLLRILVLSTMFGGLVWLRPAVIFTSIPWPAAWMPSVSMHND